jgi:Spy/CpxP family protein refolding chaperone
MKTLLWAAVIAMLSAQVVFAGEGSGKSGQRGGAERMARMQKHLDLSDDQVTQIRDIKQNGGSREDVQAVLTEDQLSKMQAHRAKREAKRAEHEPAAEK